MNLLKVVTAVFSATNIMTTFSYLLSASYKKLFKDPVMMDFILKGVGIRLEGGWHKIGGWIAHYVIGLVMVIYYELIWRYTLVQFGIVSSVIGITCWRAI